MAAAILRDGRFLAGRRDREPHRGRWELPGGKVEPGEADRAALQRELWEELGLSDCAIGAQVGGDWPLEGNHIMRVFEVALASPAEPAPLEGHDRLRWVGRGDADDLAWIPADLPIVAALLAGLPG